MNIRNTTAVDLNAILYKARIDLAHLYDKSAAKFAKKVKARQESDQAAFHRQQAETLRTAILDLFWDQERLGFYDFNTTSGGRNEQLTAAHWYPLWAGIIPNEVQTNATKAFGAYSSLNLVMKKYNGTVPSTFVPTGLQWGEPLSIPVLNVERLRYFYFYLQTSRTLGHHTFTLPSRRSRACPETYLPTRSQHRLPTIHGTFYPTIT
jgi:alpha,alpha-trehalase